MTDRELRPVGRFEWEQIILRARLSGLITGNARGTRGGVSGAAFKAVALAWAAHADPDGGNIYPGDATIAVEAEVGLKVVKAVKAAMIELGLTERVQAGARRLRRHDVYRLTLPTDLLDRVEVLTPAALRMAAVAEYERQRGKRGGSTGPLKGPIAEGPSDPRQNGVEGPQDPPQADAAEIHGGSNGPTNSGCGGSDGTVVGGPMDRDTNHDRAISLPSPTQVDLRTAVTGPRAREAADQISEDEKTRPVGERLPDRCRHGLRSRIRGDGLPTCALCRRERAGPTTLAAVVPLHRRTA